jgi:hypothetical protein
MVTDGERGGTRARYHGVAKTRLERFIRSRGLYPAQVGRASHVCRQRLHLWRIGKAWPTLSSLRRLVRGIRELTDNPNVNANDLFPLDEND